MFSLDRSFQLEAQTTRSGVSRLDETEGKNLQIKISTSFLSSFLFDPGPTPKWEMKRRCLKCQAQCLSSLG